MDECNVDEACIGFYWETKYSDGECVLKSTITEKLKNNKYISARKTHNERQDQKARIDDGNSFIYDGLTIWTYIIYFKLLFKLKIANLLFSF